MKKILSTILAGAILISSIGTAAAFAAEPGTDTSTTATFAEGVLESSKDSSSNEVAVEKVSNAKDPEIEKVFAEKKEPAKLSFWQATKIWLIANILLAPMVIAIGESARLRHPFEILPSVPKKCLKEVVSIPTNINDLIERCDAGDRSNSVPCLMTFANEKFSPYWSYFKHSNKLSFSSISMDLLPLFLQGPFKNCSMHTGQIREKYNECEKYMDFTRILPAIKDQVNCCFVNKIKSKLSSVSDYICEFPLEAENTLVKSVSIIFPRCQRKTPQDCDLSDKIGHSEFYIELNLKK